MSSTTPASRAVAYAKARRQLLITLPYGRSSSQVGGRARIHSGPVNAVAAPQNSRLCSLVVSGSDRVDDLSSLGLLFRRP